MMAYLADVGQLVLEVLKPGTAELLGRVKVPLRFREVFDRVPQPQVPLPAGERPGEDGEATVRGDFTVWGPRISDVAAAGGPSEVVLGDVTLALHLRFGQRSLIRQTLQRSMLASAGADQAGDAATPLPLSLGGKEAAGALSRGWALAPVLSSFQLHEALVAADVTDTLPLFPNALSQPATRGASGRGGHKPRYVPPDARGEATAAPPSQLHHQPRRPPHQEEQENELSRPLSPSRRAVRSPTHAPRRYSPGAPTAGSPSRRAVGSAGVLSPSAANELASAAQALKEALKPPARLKTPPPPQKLRLPTPPPSPPPPLPLEPKPEAEDYLGQLLRRGFELRAAIGNALAPPPHGPDGAGDEAEAKAASTPDFRFGGSSGSGGREETAKKAAPLNAAPPPPQSTEQQLPWSAPGMPGMPPLPPESKGSTKSGLTGVGLGAAAELGDVVAALRQAGRIPGGGGGGSSSSSNSGRGSLGTAAAPGGTTMEGWEWAAVEATVAEEGLADEKTLNALLEKVLPTR
jgi:hypothetical protein